MEPLAAALWSIYEATKEAGYVQDISAGIFRSDYMLHGEDHLKQVEFNSFSCSGGAHANKANEMHRYLARTGLYDVDETPFDLGSLPRNQNIQSLASGLAQAHAAYGPPRSKTAKRTAVLFVVQPYNVRSPSVPQSRQLWMWKTEQYQSLISPMNGLLNMHCGIGQSPFPPIEWTGAMCSRTAR